MRMPFTRLALCLCIAFAAPLLHAGGLAPDTAATVNGQPIPRAWLDELARARQVQGTPTESQGRRQILDDLVMAELLVQRARQSGIAARPEVRAGQALAHKMLLGQRLLQHLSDEMQIDEATLLARYRAEPPQQEIEASHIVVADESTAREVLAQLRRGTSFAALARRHSIDDGTRERGGALGPMSAQELTEPFARAALALKPGQTTPEPVQTEFGWHVIRLHTLRTHPRPAFESIKASLRQQVVAERLQAQLDQWKKDAKLTVVQAP